MATMCVGKNSLEMQGSNMELPPGFRFHPTDEELVSYYLTRKIRNPDFSVRAIGEVDLNKCEPWDLPVKATFGEKEWYFFSLRDRKYPTGLRTNRATEKGYWKATGKDKDVLRSGDHSLVGMKKTLVFYRGRAPKGEKTSWIMHEYRLESDSSNQTNQELPRSKDEWVVCRVFYKNGGGRHKYVLHSGLDSLPNNSDSAIPGHLESSPNPSVNEDGDCDTRVKGAEREVTWMGGPKLGVSITPTRLKSIAASSPDTNISLYNQNPNFLDFGISPHGAMSNMTSLKSFNRNGNRMRLKDEPYYACEGEDGAQTNQGLGLDYSWCGGVIYQDMSLEGPIAPFLSLTAEIDCITESFSEEQQARPPSRIRSLSGVPEIHGPMDTLQEIMWAY